MPPATKEQLVRGGLRVSALSAAWTILASGIGIWVGVSHSSLALIAFGAVGLLDAAGSITLAIHFRLIGTGPDRADRVERVALRIITAGLLVVGCVTAIVSVVRLFGDNSHPHESVVGSVIAGASMCVLTLLAARKRWLAARIPSHPLLADSHLSTIGAVLAGVTLAGTLAIDAFGWAWADAVAALGVSIIAIRLGIELTRESQ